MNTENRKTNESHKFILNLSQRLDQISSNKQVTLQNLLIYCTWKNIRKQLKSNKPKLIAPTCNDELPGGSYIIVYFHSSCLVMDISKDYKRLKQ